MVFEDSTLVLTNGGRVRFAQGLSGISPYQEYLASGGVDDYLTWYEKLTIGLQDAPSDGNCYVRNNGEWVLLGSCSGDSPDTPEPDEPVPAVGELYYGYIPMDLEDETTSSVKELKEDFINKAITEGTFIKSTDMTDRAIELSPTGYSWLVALVPSDKKVLKDDGLGGKVPFLLDNLVPGTITGANKHPFVFDNKIFDMYGEIQIVSGITTLYIESAV